jgi:hypothetical protein
MKKKEKRKKKKRSGRAEGGIYRRERRQGYEGARLDAVSGVPALPGI